MQKSATAIVPPVLGMLALLATSWSGPDAAAAPATISPVVGTGPDPRPRPYVSDLNYPVGEVDSVTLLDPARQDWPVPLLIRYPLGATGPRPIVIWNHGGTPSVKGETRSEEWGRTFAAAGYVVIHPARVPVTDVTPFAAECAVEGFVAPEECAHYIAQSKFGTMTAVFVMKSLPQIEAQVPALSRLLDTARIVVGGHSGGSPVPLALAGAERRYAGAAQHDRHPRPIAFIATGPHGADYGSFDDGFHEDSFNQIDARPFLWISGRGDETGPVSAANHEPSETRVAAWLTSTRGNKYLSWDNDLAAVHETMDIHKCDQSAVQQAHCSAFAMLGVAFLDAFARQRPEAVHYLQSSAYEGFSGGVIELHRR